MTYTPWLLLVFGLLGVLLHNLVQLNAIKKSNPNGDVNYKQYFKMEWITMLISVIVVGLAVIFSQNVEKLYNAGDWLGPVYIPIGYFAQSLLVKWMGKAEQTLGTKDGTNSQNP